MKFWKRLLALLRRGNAKPPRPAKSAVSPRVRTMHWPDDDLPREGKR